MRLIVSPESLTQSVLWTRLAVVESRDGTILDVIRKVEDKIVSRQKSYISRILYLDF